MRVRVGFLLALGPQIRRIQHAHLHGAPIDRDLRGALVELLGQRYRDAGLRDVTVSVHDGARHEVFNETNRDEITAEVITWLASHT